MNSVRYFFAVTAVAFSLGLAVSSVTAGSMGNGGVQRQRLVVDSVDATSGTIVLKSLADNSMHPYKINASTRVTIGSVKASISQIEPGQRVANLHTAVGPSPQTLDTIIFFQAVPAPVVPAKN
ncbi:MAG TPA: hypothetical protein VHD32_10460 [Candidatus Didemnitutus sp.]|nr:hypothetical protein [Candidatus Didemnitutus sp.]